MATPRATQKAAFTARRVCLRITAMPSLRRPGNEPRRLLVGHRQSGADSRLEGGMDSQSSRADEELDKAEAEIGQDRERGHAEGRADHALELVCGLSDDDVAEPATARDGRDRRGRDDVDG